VVDCPPLSGGEPVCVDRDMWEKIVLDLLSNAFKFTLEGGIEVRLRDDGSAVELIVKDTGSGIPESELPRDRLFTNGKEALDARLSSNRCNDAGFELMTALRSDPATRAIPIVMLSARAGEESRINRFISARPRRRATTPVSPLITGGDHKIYPPRRCDPPTCTPSTLDLCYLKFRVLQFLHVLIAGVGGCVFCTRNRYLEVSRAPALGCKDSASVSRVSVGLIVREPCLFVDGAYSLFIHGSDCRPALYFCRAGPKYRNMGW
jgi:hypothetical protein